MGVRVSQFYVVFFALSGFLISGSSIAKLQPQAIHRNVRQNFVDTTRLDGAVPIGNPTTIGAQPATPSPPASIATEPTFNPPSTTTITSPATTITSPATTGGVWCVANPSASPTALQVALDYACGYGGSDCTAIQPGGGCYDPSTVQSHASYAFNSYYQKNPVPNSCVFGGTAQLVYTDPSNGNCRYASSSTTSTAAEPPPSPPPPVILSPPTDLSPPTTMDPTTDTPMTPDGFGPPYEGSEEPAGEPSSATFASSRSFIYFIATGIYWILVANSF
ncbi:hypothetical protein ACFE04_012182 [Oxalis oulophora]